MEPKLLEKYWNGETSLEEEARLMEDMSGSNSSDAAYFKMIAAMRQDKSRLTLDQIKEHTPQQSPAASPRVMPLYRLIASAAAILLFAAVSAGLWNYTQSVTQPVQMAETYEDPYEAYQEVREALAFMSAKLNKSQGEAMINIQKAGTYAEMFK